MSSRERDIKLIDRAKLGDQKAYSRLLELYYDSLYANLSKKMKGSSYVDDVALEAFQKAFKKLSMYQPKYAFSTWLYRIAHNQMIDHYRKEKHRKLDVSLNFYEEGEEKEIMIDSGVDTPEDQLIRKQNKEAVHHLVQSLPGDYRDVIDLRYLQEFSYQEIADEMQIPIGTVKAKLFRARKLLSRIFTLNNLKA